MSSLRVLRELLLRRPVLLGANPFVPICLPRSVDLVQDGSNLALELDLPTPHAVREVALLADSNPGGSRFGPPLDIVTPTAAEINAGLATRLDYVRSAFLQQSGIAAHISAEVATARYDTVLLMIVDGLGYADVQGWPWQIAPCFVDGPSITTFGYPNVVSTPSLARRLATLGLSQALGFTYWGRSNTLTEQLFSGVPLHKVDHFQALLKQLETFNLRSAYVQIVREGLDRMVHHRREVAPLERQATVDELQHNCEQLAALITGQGLRGCIFVTADHGLLWKNEHAFSALETNDHQHQRYGTLCPADPALAAAFPANGTTYYAYHYPYVGAAIPNNAAGVHGGCSYQESFVPLVQIEVAP